MDSCDEAAAAEATKLKIEKVYLDQICRKIYQCTDNGEFCCVLALNDELFTKQVPFALLCFVLLCFKVLHFSFHFYLPASFT